MALFFSGNGLSALVYAQAILFSRDFKDTQRWSREACILAPVA